jgi:hypothetical protein
MYSHKATEGWAEASTTHGGRSIGFGSGDIQHRGYQPFSLQHGLARSACNNRDIRAPSVVDLLLPTVILHPRDLLINRNGHKQELGYSTHQRA